MLINVFRKLNWVDLFIIIAFMRICYVSFKTGFTIEIFKLLGTVFSIYFAMHYFTLISDVVFRRSAVADKAPLEFTDFIAFVLLIIAGYLFFVLLRSVFYMFMKMDAVPNLQKWGGFVLGILRGFLFASLILFILVISSFNYTKDSVRNSYSGNSLFKLAPATYHWLWKNVSSKFMNSEKSNSVISEIEDDLAKK